jgi:putative membrane protein
MSDAVDTTPRDDPDEGAGQHDPDEGGGQHREPDARFLLANERTFLAWNRTGLALIISGIGVTQVLDEFRHRNLIGLPLLVLGGLIGPLGLQKWKANDAALRAEAPLPPSPLPPILAFMIAGVGIGALIAAIAG